MNKKTYTLIATLAAAALSAQEPPPPPPPPHFGVVTAAGPSDVLFTTSEKSVAAFGVAGTEAKFVSFEMSYGGKPITGAPYAADAVTETTQTLSDGNHITRKSTSKTYRDSQGRTRREQSFQAVGPWATGNDAPVMIQISDPVAGVSYSLNSSSKEATKFELQSAQTQDQMKANMQKRIAETKASGAKMTTSTFTTKVSPPKEESLGSQMVNGVQAEGTSTTITIPAGEIGNDQPINIVDERWFSTSLQTLVKSVHNDPRMGVTTYQLTNIDRAEPSPALFEVPADYKVTTLDRSSLPTVMDKLQMEKIQIHKSQE